MVTYMDVFLVNPAITAKRMSVATNLVLMSCFWDNRNTVSAKRTAQIKKNGTHVVSFKMIVMYMEKHGTRSIRANRQMNTFSGILARVLTQARESINEKDPTSNCKIIRSWNPTISCPKNRPILSNAP